MTDQILLVASSNGDPGMAAGMAILRAGGSALDAIEAACQVIEADPDDHTVGVGGYPNDLGEVELDASIMEGTGRRAGAVGALKDYPHPISVARQILERLPQHVLLVGAGAADFARQCGFETANLLTDVAEKAWRNRIGSGPAVDPAHVAGTVNFLARDAEGRIASAVSTSGWAFKYPGRVGDSAVIGAGNYCDDRFGACACTGLGEWSIRAGIARQVLLLLHSGRTLTEACSTALQDLGDIPLPDCARPVMNLVAIDALGNHGGFSVSEGDAFYETYLYQTTDMSAPQRNDCVRVLLE